MIYTLLLVMTSWMNPDGVIIICIQNVSLAHVERKPFHEFPSHLNDFEL